MARWVRWSAEEYDLLVEFYEEYGTRPPEAVLGRLQFELRKRARDKTPRADEPTFRSLGSLYSQLHRLRRLEAQEPGIERELPPAMVRAWNRRAQRKAEGGVSPLVGGDLERIEAGRKELVAFLFEFEELLEGFMQRATELTTVVQAEDFRAAWLELGQAENFGRARAAIMAPAAGPEIVEVGLVGSQLHLKLRGFREALKRIGSQWTWPLLRPAFRWANVVLGSLTRTATLGLIVDPIQEMKEAVEAALEQEEELAAHD